MLMHVLTPLSRPDAHPFRVLISAILALICSWSPLLAEIAPDSPYARKTAYFGGLSRQLFGGDRNDITIATEMFFKEIVNRIGHHDTVKFKVYESKSEILRAMRHDKLDTIFANPIDYLDLDPQINPNFRYTLTYGPVPEQRVYLITYAEDKILGLEDLRSKRLSIPSGYILGMTYLEVLLGRDDLPAPRRFFSSVASTNSSNAAILDVVFQKADLAVTSDVAFRLATELNPQINGLIDILDVSDPFIPFIIGVNKQVPRDFTDSVDEILSDIGHQPRLRRILAMFSATDVVKVSDQQLENLKALKQEHERLRGNH
ncbi:MAG: PhnD/SsuA/transferrin family substrate-binding protein [Candidatus Thiodiazotropha sp.]